MMGWILVHGAYQATKFINEKLTVKATKKRYKKGVVHGAIDVVLTIGKPNCTAREFIKKCKWAGEPFPVKKVQVKFPK